MDRRDFLKGAGAVVAATTIVKATREEEPDALVQRELVYKKQVYPLVTDLEGLRLIDPVAHHSFLAGMDESTRVQITDDELRRMRFALTVRKGWDVDFGSPLGYNPITRRWSFYEYCEEDGFDIFGPSGLGTKSDPIILWEFPPA